MRPALGSVALIDVADDGWDGVYRLYGTRIADRTSTDMTGRKVSELDDGSYLATFACALLRAAHTRRMPVYASYRQPASVSATQWSWLVLPLTDQVQNVVRYLLGAAYTRFYMRPSYVANYLRIQQAGLRDVVARLDARVAGMHSRREAAEMTRNVTA